MEKRNERNEFKMVKQDKEGHYFVLAGCNKWDISIIPENASIRIGYNRIPISGSIELGDISVEDSFDLAKLFCKFAVRDPKLLENIMNLIDVEYEKIQSNSLYKIKHE
jgi:hypothetical protein